MKLNLGDGGLNPEGYVGVDRINGQEVYPLAYDDNSIDEIRASHILEHFLYTEANKVLRHWVSKLKPGGIIKIAVPDFNKIVDGYKKGDKERTVQVIMGGQLDENDRHGSIFDKITLTEMMQRSGLVNITEWQSDFEDCSSLNISLNLQGTKASKEALRYKNTEDLAQQCRNVYSQYGEDGVVAAIFDKIGTTNKMCFEVGAADGILFSNTRQWVEKGWKAILIEKDPEIYQRLLENATKDCICENVAVEASGDNTLDKILERHNAPCDIDLMCIDIDGQDWHVWNSMLKYQPRVMIVEYACDKATHPEFIPKLGGEGQAGCNAIERLALSKNYVALIQTHCNIILVRTDLASLIVEETPATVEDRSRAVRVMAVMSVPRLGFTDNFSSVTRHMISQGIQVDKGQGVFWGQVLTRMMEQHLNDDLKYIFTIDYDTMFRGEHVTRLLQLMEMHPEADAIIPLQIKREEPCVMLGLLNDDGTAKTRVTREEMKHDLIPMFTGHFGLTIFRVDALKKLKKPWFLAVPGPDGSWNDGRLDEDIYFWHNFKKSGCKAFAAPGVKIAHLQMMATVPGDDSEGWEVKHLQLNDIEKEWPAYLIPNCS